MEEKVVEYPISPKYVPNWSVGDALRELIANALDTQTKIHLYYDGMYGHIVDSSVGISYSYWVLGEGEGGQIGFFHEGLKLAMLVLARENRKVNVITVGYSVIPSLVYSDTFQAKILSLQFLGGNKDTGTHIMIQCSEEEFNEAKKKFLTINPVKYLDKDLEILDTPGSLYINGVFVQNISSLWGYNITDKSITNRDRSVVDNKRLVEHIRTCLYHLKKEEMIREFITSSKKRGVNNNYIEYMWFTPNDICKKAWKKVFIDLYGTYACLPSLSRANQYVTGIGFSVVDEFTYPVDHILKESGIPTAMDIIEKNINKHPIVRLETPLTQIEQKNLSVAKRLARSVVKNTNVTQIRVVEDFNHYNPNRCCVNGIYIDNKVYIRRDLLTMPLDIVTGVIIHELLHGKGYVDESRDFENAMTNLLGYLTVSLFGKSPIVIDCIKNLEDVEVDA